MAAASARLWSRALAPRDRSRWWAAMDAGTDMHEREARVQARGQMADAVREAAMG